MKRMKIIICIILLSAAIAAVCFVHMYKQREMASEIFLVVSGTNPEEVIEMRREFCKVEELQEKNFVLKNVRNERYYIPNIYLDNFQVGDDVLLIYRSRTPLDNSGYLADVYKIYPDDNKLLYPAK